MCKHDSLSPRVHGSRAEDRRRHPGRSRQRLRSRPAPLRSARPPAFPGSHQRGTRAPSVPSRGRRRQEKGSVVFPSSFLPLTGLLTGSDSPDGNPPRLSRPLLLQAPRPRLMCLCPDRGKEEQEKPQTSFENQFVGRAWSARRRPGHSAILKTPGGPPIAGAASCLPSPPTLLRRPRCWA